MRCTEIVQTAHQKHAIFKSGCRADQSATAACQTRQTLPEGCIEPFDESGVDAPGATLGHQNNRLYLLRVTLMGPGVRKRPKALRDPVVPEEEFELQQDEVDATLAT